MEKLNAEGRRVRDFSRARLKRKNRIFHVGSAAQICKAAECRHEPDKLPARSERVVISLEQSIETLSVRVDKLEHETADLADRTNSAAITQAAVNEKLNSVLVTLGELKAGLAALQQQPSRRWDTLVSAIISALVAVCIGFLSGKLLK